MTWRAEPAQAPVLGRGAGLRQRARRCPTWSSGSSGSRQLDGAAGGVFVVDGSPDDSRGGAAAAAAASAVRVAAHRPLPQLRLLRGHPHRASRPPGATFIAAMAADLQEPAELIQKFFAAAAPGSTTWRSGRAAGATTRARRARSRARLLVDCTAARAPRDPARRGRHLRVHARGRATSSSSCGESHTRAWSGCCTGSASAGSRCPYARAARAARAERLVVRASGPLLPRQRLLVHRRAGHRARRSSARSDVGLVPRRVVVLVAWAARARSTVRATRR